MKKWKYVVWGIRGEMFARSRAAVRARLYKAMKDAGYREAFVDFIQGVKIRRAQ